ncbi:unnamed protein product [Brachionus calyciflorus]|uniref:Reverse transcriptase domain-containing protein n=1 Tax=Brachionus calyciflorus TaxID=104777 RepID=A0A813U0U2_9BILA|nr:unnamed protein product [Brachionus calyciflorus]
MTESDGNITSDPNKICEILNNHFESVFLKDENPIIHELEEKNVLKSMGTDLINPRELKKTEEVIAIPLSNIFIKLFNNGSVPNQCKKANNTPIFKKGSKKLASNYRPVSLTSISCKIIEKLIKKTIMEHLIVNKLISIRQHGFMEKKSCITNLLEIFDLVTEAIHNGFPIDMIYLDFAKAFDSFQHKRLLNKLKKYGFDNKLIKWIESFLTNRRQRFVLGKSESSWANVLSGV